MSHAPAALKGLYEPIQGEIDRVEELLRTELANENPFVSQLLTHSTKFQGKRVRPALLLHSAHLLGEATEVHVALGAVVEMLHTATLVQSAFGVGLTRERTVSMAALAALAALERPRALIMAGPRCCTVEMKSFSSHSVCLMTSGTGRVPMRALKKSGYIVAL